MVSLIDSLIEPRFLHRIGSSTFGNPLLVIRMSPYESMGWKYLEFDDKSQTNKNKSCSNIFDYLVQKYDLWCIGSISVTRLERYSRKSFIIS